MPNEIQLYLCALCKQWYQRQTGHVQWQCGVLHGANECCHCEEKVVSSEQIRAIEGILSPPSKQVCGNCGDLGLSGERCVRQNRRVKDPDTETCLDWSAF